ncbi:(Fe-S)-binding protein [Amycolatopsis sp. La24]|uniref:(Fe-S)-binding protein n=1 Tax=Amycolatopsis sp. La24 TaxID=3028304 RepID=UPI0023B0AE96|nr:(Fe-S)-binding protein [Amycolatopsis sp. La24]
MSVRVALLGTCLADTLYPGVLKATLRLLERLGCTVDFPAGQTCCGQMHFNTGYRREAADLASAFERAFAGHAVVVAPSGSCAGMVRHSYRRLPGFAGTLPDKTYELSEFLVDVLGVTDVGAYFPHSVTYHPTCHSLRMLGVADRPERLLKSVRGIRLVPLSGAESCCGFGGTFALKNADTSSEMLADKVRAVQASGVEVLTAGDSSCLMHIGGGLRRLDAGARPLHLAEILASTEEEPWSATP